MAKTTGPLLSLRARGQIAKTLVYADWRGIPYARTYVIPQNPRTSEQLFTRQAFEYLNAVFGAYDVFLNEAYESLTTGRPLTARNAWVRQNLSLIRSDVDTTDLVTFNGQSPIPAPTTPVITGGVGTITASAADAPTIGDWAPFSLVLIAFTDADVSSPGPYPIHIQSANDVTTPYAPALAAVPPGDYHAALMWQYGHTTTTLPQRYGRSFDAIVTVT